METIPQPRARLSSHRSNQIPSTRIRGCSRRRTCGTVICSVAAVALACGGGEEVTPAPPAGTATGISQRYVGCIGPTAQANTYVLSVAEGRDFTTGEPPGTPIPQKSKLPGAPPPVPPVTVTSGTPGGGPTPITKIVTYSLIGKDLRQYAECNVGRLLVGDYKIKAWRKSGLLSPSIVTGIVRTIKHDMIASKMGELPVSELHSVEDKLREILAL
jgi:hypothetical protein